MTVIGVVNNMPDSALQTTERQFRELLGAVSGDRQVRLRFFSIADVPRQEAGRSYVAGEYEDIGELWGSGVDGLIVTGTEPRANSLHEEPYWRTLTRLVDWAEENTCSTVWSCLAAHAAVRYLDGVERQRFPEKLSGVFECAIAAEHPIVAGMPPRWRMPHSRHNTLPQDALGASGYETLSVSPEAGADMFAKQRRSLFLFVQGHPEYDPGALLREYQRDIGRFLSGKRESYPDMPRGYFDQETASSMEAFRREAMRHRRIETLDTFSAATPRPAPAHSWREAAERIYANWMSVLDGSPTRRAAQAESPGAATAPLR